MAWKGRASTREIDYDRLKTSLTNSGEQTQNNALYQTVFRLIEGAQFFRDSLLGKFDKDSKINLTNQVAERLAVINGGTYSKLYTPDLTLVANLSGAGVDFLPYYQNGNVVTVSGRIQVNPITNNQDTRLGISLPLKSYFKFDYQCAGSASSPTENQAGAIIGDVTNARAELRFKTTTNATFDMFFIFSYIILQQ